ncbi:hypothetical protein [Salinarimonas soli]|uniref:Uncharacterized protein n=1 Tax=Salinarimonas soli TaxID=1638099 RepID=A0A5B2VB78_9HYPH|nr:hypothetical protein [Salinarimonas soli]KAA2235579.1 hypothetical protein F0L46_18945 [Salinarimonas soli]
MSNVIKFKPRPVSTTDIRREPIAEKGVRPRFEVIGDAAESDFVIVEALLTRDQASRLLPVLRELTA